MWTTKRHASMTGYIGRWKPLPGREGYFCVQFIITLGNEFKRGILYPSKKVLFSGFIELTWEPPQNFDTGKIAWRSTLGQVAWHLFSWLLTLLVGWALFSLFRSAIQNLSSFWRDISPIPQNYFVLNQKKEKEKSLAKLGLFMSWIWGQKTLCL